MLNLDRTRPLGKVRSTGGRRDRCSSNQQSRTENSGNIPLNNKEVKYGFDSGKPQRGLLRIIRLRKRNSNKGRKTED